MREYDSTLREGEGACDALLHYAPIQNDGRITGWYVGGHGWSTDHKRQKLFDQKRDAGPVCHELRSLCPHNGAVINIEAAVLAPAVEGFPPTQQFPELAEAQALLAALSP